MSDFSKQLDGLSERLSQPQNIVIVPHKDPDGDAIGSCLAWCRVLNAAGHKSTVVLPDAAPASLLWMEGSASMLVFAEDAEGATARIAEATLLLYLDFNTLSRTGKMAAVLQERTLPVVLIDHHPFPDTSLAEILFSEVKVSSTCELSYGLMKALGFVPDKAAAECLYTGIMTDTGMLNHNSAHPAIYKTVAELLELGVDKDKVHREVFHSSSASRMRLIGHALCNKMHLLFGGQVAYIALSDEELQAFDYRAGDTEGLVNMPLSIEGVEIAALMTEKEGGQIKMSFRSKGKLAVNAFSEQYFSGGGHRNAAGGEFWGTLADAEVRFKESMSVYLQDVKP